MLQRGRPRGSSTPKPCQSDGCSNLARYYGYCPSHCNTSQHRRNYIRQRRYGLLPGQFEAMLAEQKGKCAGCCANADELTSSLCVDHCHQTGRIRGLLCAACNMALGKVKDNRTTLLRLAEYLKEAA